MLTKAFVVIMDVAIFPLKCKDTRGRAKPVIGHGTYLRRKSANVAGQKRQTQQWVCKDRKYRELKGSREMANPVQGSARPKENLGGKPK